MDRPDIDVNFAEFSPLSLHMVPEWRDYIAHLEAEIAKLRQELKEFND